MRGSHRSVGVLVMWMALAGAAEAQDVQVNNTATFLGNGRYDWKVFLVAERSVLSRIEYVEYTLHPSFPNPVRRVANPAGGFALSSNGWGEFNILVSVAFKDGRVMKLQHWLSLQSVTGTQMSKAMQLDHTSKHGDVKARNTSKAVADGRWDWEIFIEADDRTLAEVRCVKYTLHPTFPDPVRTSCTRGSVAGRGFALKSNGWGTFTVGVEVTFNDGDVRYLTHNLTFGTDVPRAPASRK